MAGSRCVTLRRQVQPVVPAGSLREREGAGEKGCGGGVPGRGQAGAGGLGCGREEGAGAAPRPPGAMQ